MPQANAGSAIGSLGRQAALAPIVELVMNMLRLCATNFVFRDRANYPKPESITFDC